MAWPRFFVEHLPASGHVELDEDESRHASGVLRMSIGDVCLAFDGCGGEARCTVVRVSKRSVELNVVERIDTDRELSKKIHFAVALPKGDRQKTLIDFLVQLGVYSFQPLITKRGVAQPVDAALVRLRRSVLESSKQCGRNWLMQVLAPVDLRQLAQPVTDTAVATSVAASVADAASVGSNVDFGRADAGSVGHANNHANNHAKSRVLKLFAHPYGDVKQLHQLQSEAKSVEAITVLIGPEGGFTEDEADALRDAGRIATSLGPRILRVEVAATHVASWLAELAF